MIQFLTFLSLIVGGHQQPFKASLRHHQKITKFFQYPRFIEVDRFLGFFLSDMGEDEATFDEHVLWLGQGENSPIFF